MIVQTLPCLFQAVDIFAAFSSSADNRLTIMKEIAKMWTVPISDTKTLYPVNKPVIQVSAFFNMFSCFSSMKFLVLIFGKYLQELRSDLRIGRITLPRTRITVSEFDIVWFRKCNACSFFAKLLYVVSAVMSRQETVC